jgi:hypothetical protein
MTEVVYVSQLHEKALPLRLTPISDNRRLRDIQVNVRYLGPVNFFDVIWHYHRAHPDDDDGAYKLQLISADFLGDDDATQALWQMAGQYMAISRQLGDERQFFDERLSFRFSVEGRDNAIYKRVLKLLDASFARVMERQQILPIRQQDVTILVPATPKYAVRAGPSGRQQLGRVSRSPALGRISLERGTGPAENIMSFLSGGQRRRSRSSRRSSRRRRGRK